MSFIAGTYTANYGGFSLGVIEDGFTIEWTSRAEDIITDIGGETKVDGVFRGVEVNVSFVLAEWDAAGAQGAFWPWSATFGQPGQIGRLLSSMALSLVLTKCGASGNQVPNSITFDLAILSPGFNVSTLFANKHRKIPLQMSVLPMGTNSTAGLQQCELLRFFTTA